MSRDLASERRGTLLWFRRDLRLADHPALRAAIARGGPVWPVFILDPETEAAGGAAPQWRLSRSLAALAQSLDALGSKLILRRGEALETLRDLLRETGAEGVHWSRLYDPASIARDTAVKAALKADGIAAESYGGHLLVEPFAVQTKTGGFFKVYTPFWKAVRSTLAPGAPEPTPARLPVPEKWPASLALDDLRLEQAMNRGGAVVSAFAQVGERAAQDKLTAFLESRVARYGEDRDRPDLDGTSRLSDHLSLGEISPRSVWAATEAAVARHPSAEPSLETYLQEIVWREFGYHLLYHTPHIAERNWRSEWDGFPWRGENDDVQRWRQGRTGVPIIDAAMRELYVTGTMHNRCRMLVGSYLTKNLLTHWQLGERWFAECLIDWDPASNAMGWQWAAGSGADASPFFRIFNPETQAQKFDPAGDYVARWLPEIAARDLARQPHADGLRFFDACPRSWGLSPDAPYPAPSLSLKEGRQRALDAYAELSAANKAKKLKEIAS